MRLVKIYFTVLLLQLPLPSLKFPSKPLPVHIESGAGGYIRSDAGYASCVSSACCNFKNLFYDYGCRRIGDKLPRLGRRFIDNQAGGLGR